MTKDDLMDLSLVFADRADEQNDAQDHDELHAASDLCVILAMNPYHVTAYIERWLLELSKH